MDPEDPLPLADNALPKVRADDLAALLDLSPDAVVVYGGDFRFLYANTAALRKMGRLTSDVIGQVVWHAFPEGVDPFREPLTRAMRERTAADFAVEYAPGRWIEGRCCPLDLADRPGEPALAVFFRDATADRRAREALLTSEERLRLAVEGSSLGVWQWNIVSGELYWSDTTRLLLGFRSPERPTYEKFMSAIHPDDRERTHQAVRAALDRGEPYDVEYRCVWQDGTLHWHISRGSCYYDEQGAAVRMEGILIDITDRKRIEDELRAWAERDALLLRIERSIRETVDPEEIQRIAVRELGLALGVDRCWYSQYDMDADLIVVGDDLFRDGLPPLAGRYRISLFGVDPEEYYPDGATLAVGDVTSADFPPMATQALRDMRVRAGISVPLFNGPRLIATLAVAMADEPREWTSSDVALVEAVASTTRSAVDAARLLADQRMQELRESLIDRIAAATRSSLDPAAIQAAGLTILGEALGLDRCYFAIYDFPRNTTTVAWDWHSSALPSISGAYRLSDFQQLMDEVFGEGETAVIPDVRSESLSPATCAILADYGLRSFIAVPLYDAGTLAAALIGGMADTVRDWTENDHWLMEVAAGQLRAALESARVQEREHRIATKLQQALQPPLPPAVPSLDIATIVRPALDEAAIGGDFYDVFPLDKSLYVFVIGDVSGKGLAAAAQVATVRNMLRGFIYEYRNPSEATTRLNQVLTAHDLVTGFVTATVCTYDIQTRELAAVSCGHEPGLIRRASSGSVDVLSADGPPLGMYEGAVYQEHPHVLAVGDTLVLYTDGVSEAGPTRVQLYGTEGAIRLMEGIDPDLSAAAVAQRIVDAAAGFAQGELPDDVCVLVIRPRGA